MTTQKTQYVEVRTDINAKLLAISGFILASLISVGVVYFGFYGLVDSFEHLNRGSYYVEISAWDFPTGQRQP